MELWKEKKLIVSWTQPSTSNFKFIFERLSKNCPIMFLLLESFVRKQTKKINVAIQVRFDDKFFIRSQQKDFYQQRLQQKGLHSIFERKDLNENEWTSFATFHWKRNCSSIMLMPSISCGRYYKLLWRDSNPRTLEFEARALYRRKTLSPMLS